VAPVLRRWDLPVQGEVHEARLWGCPAYLCPAAVPYRGGMSRRIAKRPQATQQSRQLQLIAIRFPVLLQP
jgi:hypothetical protein